MRFKARLGDEDPAVTAECLTALMTAAPRESLPFVREFLHTHRDAIQEGAAFALAESRRPDALDVLKEYWPNARGGSLQDVLLLAIAMTRLPDALEFLMVLVIADNQAAALAALSALAIHRHNESIRQRIAAVVAEKLATAPCRNGSRVSSRHRSSGRAVGHRSVSYAIRQRLGRDPEIHTDVGHAGPQRDGTARSRRLEVLREVLGRG